jgi:hypothetical protein
MELFGLILAVPFTGLASAVYVWGVLRFVVPRSGLATVLRALSWLPLLATFSELIFVRAVGPVAARTIVGPAFMAIHSLFLVTPPALINVLLLYRRPPSWRRAFIAVAVSWGICFGLLLFNIVVSEALFGIDGSGGPFGRP